MERCVCSVTFGLGYIHLPLIRNMPLHGYLQAYRKQPSLLWRTLAKLAWIPGGLTRHPSPAAPALPGPGRWACCG